MLFVCVCVCVGTLTAVESFLTASTGPEVCIFIMVCVIIHTGSCPISHAVCVCREGVSMTGRGSRRCTGWRTARS